MKKSSLTKYEIGALCLLLIMAVVFGVLTAINRDRPGAYFEDTVLPISQEGEKAVYSGKVRGNLVNVTVIPDETGTDVLVHVDGELVVPYRVEYPEGSVTYLGVSFPRLEIIRDDKVLFRGGYDPNPLFFGTLLRDAEGEPYHSSAEDIDTPESFPEFTFSMEKIYSFARQRTDAVRGNWVTWFLMVLLSGVVVLDLFNPYAVYAIFPLFFGVVPDEGPSKRALMLRRAVLIALILIGYISGLLHIDYL